MRVDDLKRLHLLNHPDCAGCGIRTETVSNFFLPLCEGGKPESSNLITLCDDCHHRKTEEDRREYGW